MGQTHGRCGRHGHRMDPAMMRYLTVRSMRLFVQIEYEPDVRAYLWTQCYAVAAETVERLSKVDALPCPYLVRDIEKSMPGEQSRRARGLLGRVGRSSRLGRVSLSKVQFYLRSEESSTCLQRHDGPKSFRILWGPKGFLKHHTKWWPSNARLPVEWKWWFPKIGVPQNRCFMLYNGKPHL